MLKKIGEIYRITHDKKIVIKLTTQLLPPLYITVYDYAMKRIGTLYDIIGPVKSPFGLVKPSNEEILKQENEIIGKSVYVRVIDLEKKGGKRVKTK